MLARALSVVTVVLASACAPARSANAVSFREAPAQAGEKPHTKISPLGATGIAVLSVFAVAGASVAIFVIPQTGHGG